MTSLIRLALELKKLAAASSTERCGEVLDLGRGINSRYAVSDSPIQQDMNLPPVPLAISLAPPQTDREMRLRGVISLNPSTRPQLSASPSLQVSASLLPGYLKFQSMPIQVRFFI